MKKLGKIILTFVSVVFAVLLIALGYSAWYVTSPSGRTQDIAEQKREFATTGQTETLFGTYGRWNYRMTVTVETPEGEKSFSAVREIQAAGAKIKVPNSGGSARVVKGEAIVIDLGNRGKAFAIMRSIGGRVDYAHDVVFRAFPTDKGGLTPAGVRHYSSIKSSDVVELNISNYPQFVYFRDLNDPKTVENLIEVQSCPDAENPVYKLCVKNDRFSEVFGLGVKIKSVSIELTDAPSTENGLEIIMPWLPEYKNQMFDGERYNTIRSKLPFANSISSGAFTVGSKHKP